MLTQIIEENDYTAETEETDQVFNQWVEERHDLL